ncbi:hypothetical protein, partial [Gracilibacillus thailandensis]|uniref:hypothetical protein n=1 Tax=Gracilibacillus thailandensis TaxID=563735 RepID=UPI001969D3F0
GDSCGTVRAEDPLGEVPFFTKLAKNCPRKAEYSAGAYVSTHHQSDWKKASLYKIFITSQYISTTIFLCGIEKQLSLCGR